MKKPNDWRRGKMWKTMEWETKLEGKKEKKRRKSKLERNQPFLPIQCLVPKTCFIIYPSPFIIRPSGFCFNTFASIFPVEWTKHELLELDVLELPFCSLPPPQCQSLILAYIVLKLLLTLSSHLSFPFTSPFFPPESYNLLTYVAVAGPHIFPSLHPIPVFQKGLGCSQQPWQFPVMEHNHPGRCLCYRKWI